MIMMVQNLLDRVFPSLHNPETDTETPRTVRLNLEDQKGDQTADNPKPTDEAASSICCPT